MHAIVAKTLSSNVATQEEVQEQAKENDLLAFSFVRHPFER